MAAKAWKSDAQQCRSPDSTCWSKEGTSGPALRPHDPCQGAYNNNLGSLLSRVISVQLALSLKGYSCQPWVLLRFWFHLALFDHPPAAKRTSLKGRLSLDPAGHSPQAEAQPYEATKAGLAAATATASVTGKRRQHLSHSLIHPPAQPTHGKLAAVAAPCVAKCRLPRAFFEALVAPQVQLSRALTPEA